ncbi:MAG: porin [Anaplasma sp.]
MVRRGSIVVLSAALLLSSAQGVSAAPKSTGESGGGYAFVTGRVHSYFWLLDDGPEGVEHERHRRLEHDYTSATGGHRAGRYSVDDTLHVFDHNLGTWGTAYDASLAVGFRSNEDSLGSVYGADFSLSLPIGSAGRSFYDSVVSRGSRVFATTSYGDFSFGYQEGVESSMKIDVIGAVRAGSSASAWGKYLRCFLSHYSGVPFHMYPGLYSENLFRSMGSFDRVGMFSGSRKFLNILPMRMSYVSPKIEGFSAGFSYSPSGYKDDLFRGSVFSVQDNRAVTTAAQGSPSQQKVLAFQRPRFDLGPVYKGIMSAAVRYDWNVANVKFGASVAGEYAKSRKHNDIYPRDGDTRLFWEFEDLAAVSVGAEAEHSGIRAAFSYGYMGNSGRPKFLRSPGGLALPLRYSRSLPSYYFVASLGYGYGDFYSSVVYFSSRVNHSSSGSLSAESALDNAPFDGEHNLRDLVVSLDYSLHKKKGARFGLFASYHMFSVSQRLTRNFGDGLERGSYDGIVILSGIKFDF